MVNARAFMTELGALPPLFQSRGALAMSGSPIELDISNIVVFQIVIFVGLILILKPLLFDPMLKIFALREERTEGARDSARELEEQAGELLTRYEAELTRVNQAAAEERDRLRAETAKLEAQILAEARAAAAKIVDEGRRRIETEVNAIRFELGKQSERLAGDIATRVLGREAS
ncbi:MAG TPA: ATP synthase F0 subunit B [Polyangiaceae bacterium]|nr:ATP synthase F0 subunit B [Polyangiaceae bacterium]